LPWLFEQYWVPPDCVPPVAVQGFAPDELELEELVLIDMLDDVE
jgi:hypothetical protein